MIFITFFAMFDSFLRLRPWKVTTAAGRKAPRVFFLKESGSRATRYFLLSPELISPTPPAEKRERESQNPSP